MNNIIYLFVISCACHGVVALAKLVWVGIRVGYLWVRQCLDLGNTVNQNENSGTKEKGVMVRICAIVGVTMGIAGTVWRYRIGD